MPVLQVKDCPVDVYERLRVCASEENRSISQQALTIIEEFLDLREDAKITPRASRSLSSYFEQTPREIDYLERRRKTFERIDALPTIPTSAKSPDAAEILALVRQEEAR